MTTRYKLGGVNFPKDPLTKRWNANRIAAKGNREPVFAAVWQLECSFGTLVVDGENSFFESRFIAGGLYSAILPHPITGNMTGFTGVSIEEASFEFNDIENDRWATNPRVTFGVDIRATGTV